MNPKTKSRRNPWPIAITAYFILFFLFTVGVVGFISRQKMDLVRGDYYDEEIRYQEQLNRIIQTQPIKDRVAVAYDESRGAITISLPSPQNLTNGRVRLYRPSDETLDQDIKLSVDARGCQDIDAKNLRAGLWKVRVYWSADGHDYYFTQSVVVARKNT